MQQETYFVVRSVLLSQNSTALTLEPVAWLRESATETIEVEGETVPALEECGPHESPDAYPEHSGGKMTELRVDYDPEFRPGDYLTLTVALSR